jgi:hypothetical protein
MASARRFAIVATLGVLVAAGLVAAHTQMGFDYLRAGRGLDAAGPQIDALIHLDFGRFFDEQSFLGPVSLFVRAPFAALSLIDHGDLLAQYRLGSFICLVALGLIGVIVGAIAVRRGQPWWHGAVLVAVLLFAGPVNHSLLGGHPEDELVTALVLGATLAAAFDRKGLAIVLLGLAIGSKPWAVIAIGPVAIASSDWLRVGALGTLLGVLLVLPMPIANTSAFRDAAHGANIIDEHHLYSVWWPIARTETTSPSGRTIVVRRLPHWIDRGARPAVPVIALLLTFLVARRVRRPPLETVLVLLALVFLLRCLLDPGDIQYYHVPFMAALGCWEVLGRRRPPLLALGVGIVLSNRFIGQLAPDNGLINLVYLLWSVPLAAYLGWTLRRLTLRPHVAAA